MGSAGKSNEFLRIRCPFCGSMPYPHQVKKAAAEHGPVIQVYLMRVGGKQKAEVIPGQYQKMGKGKAKGLITYEEVTDQHPDLIAEFNQWFAERAVLFAKSGGFIK